ncbi:MAG: hypothetical protein K8L91_27025 [Anaerolineae bacterium]|nr:hypothetical protein [Anaerolineae bacterium]
MELYALPLLIMGLACPIGMGLMMWLMNREMRGKSEHSISDTALPTDAAARLVALHQHRHFLEVEMAEVNRLIELENQRSVAQLGASDYELSQ